VYAGQCLIGDASLWTHSFIVLDNDDVIEAEPRGARIAPLQPYLDRGDTLFSSDFISLTDQQRVDIVRIGRALEHTPYSFIDYAAIGLHRAGLRLPAVEDYVQSSGHMICSQLVDHVWSEAGVRLFDDQRLPQDVTPGNIANAFLERSRFAGLPEQVLVTGHA
jgi:hypothetical protein